MNEVGYWRVLLPRIAAILGLAALLGLWQATDLSGIAILGMTAVGLFGLWLVSHCLANVSCSTSLRLTVLILIAVCAGGVAVFSAEMLCATVVSRPAPMNCAMPLSRRMLAAVVFLTLPMTLPAIVAWRRK